MNLKVLVADDSSTMRKIILRSLAAVGVPGAIEANDGAEALALFQGGEFDLVLTDWNMPNKSGLDLIHAIRETDRKTPIIMITTEAEKTRVVSAIQAGCNDYLVKPFTADTLREKLAKFVG
jgi:two-component system chemotaxis response regulator CheY